MHHPTDRIAHTTEFVTPVMEHWLEREIAQWVHPMKDRSDDPSHHERTLLPRSYISLPERDIYQLLDITQWYVIIISDDWPLVNVFCHRNVLPSNKTLRKVSERSV